MTTVSWLAMVPSRLPSPSYVRVASLFLAMIALLAMPFYSQAQTRPAITGISHMCVYASDAEASDNFYGHILGAAKGADPQDGSGVRYYFGPEQFVEVLPLPAEHTLSRISCVAFSTVDAKGLHSYMEAHHTEALGAVETAKDGTVWFKSHDPEGNLVEFVQGGHPHAVPASAKPIGTRIIHVGYMVHSKAAEDKFYIELLGFKPYWFGAMKPEHTDWISMQVPDGKDWIEYMMVGDGSTTPVDHVDARELGVLNHFSIGVPNMEKAVTTLYAEDRLSPRHDGPQMGRDGKWQANWYDPDGTRVELMEFQPVMKPCCSEFTATSPTK
ncbi:catechol 2,3-dioxygenase-like lactoylglutathione lyase family enzyme [Granulicella aggregans]|uniref:Catechol 2,3-dioxygenase-like lactoylglutathione lyase family enzyme n=2 Tax=Granulicella aggregans TaxID=474949 RepID=A0A7W7ZEC7_9BACT|nr:catechol 2,3-dioxygenase-like lactoylglutathione lyase family enzyme [Granulicella aggregans]